MVCNGDSRPAARDRALRQLRDCLDTVAPHRVHLAVAAIVIDADDARNGEGEQSDDFRAAQETCAKAAASGDFFLLPADENRALDGGREAVIQDFEND